MVSYGNGSSNVHQIFLSFIFSGAVAEKQVSDMVREVTSGIRKPTETSPSSRRSTPKGPELQTDIPQSQPVSEHSAQSSVSIPGIMPLPTAESSPVKVKEERDAEAITVTPPAPVIQLKAVPEPKPVSVQPVEAAPVTYVDTTSSASVTEMSVKQEPVEMVMDPSIHERIEAPDTTPVFPTAVIKHEGTIPADSCTPVEMEYVGSLKTAKEAQDLLKEIASNLKETSFIIVEGGEFLKKAKDQALAKSKDVGVQIAGNSSMSDYDSSLSDIQVIELNPNKDPTILRDILKSPDAHCADNSFDRLLKKDIFSEKERFKALLLETVDTSMKLGPMVEEPDSSDTSPAKIAIKVKERALKECSVVLERLDKNLLEMIDCTSTSGVSSARAKNKSKNVKDEDTPIVPVVLDSPTLRRKMKKTKKERNRTRANIADSSSEALTTELEYTISKTTATNSNASIESDRHELRKSGVCFTASDVEALGSSSNVSFDLGENDTSTVVGSQTTEIGPAGESELTVTSSSDVDSYKIKDR
jgi:hypothetical protein